MVLIIVCILAGLGAGIGTGLAGLSAAVVITPMLITFCGFTAYEAVGIALASDVLASAVTAYTYGKNKNLDIKNGLVMMASVLAFTILGSWLSSLLPNAVLGGSSYVMTFIPASNEPSAALARAFGECREGQIPRSLLRIKLDTPSACCGVFDYGRSVSCKPDYKDDIKDG